MMRGTTRWAHRALALCAATVLFGCDDFGEKHSLDVQSETSAMRAAGSGSTDDSIAKLGSVASGSGNGPAVIQAQQSLGQVQLAKASAAAVDLAHLEADASATIFRIGQLARQARTSLTLANNYRQLDPKTSVEEIADVTAKARGDGNVTAYPVDATQIPSLAVAQQNKSRLDGEVAKAQEAVAAATKDRDEALAEAGKLSATVENQTGEARSAIVKQMADLRGKAALASRTLSDQTATLSRAQADLAEQTALVAQLQTAVETMSAQGASLTQSWQALTAKANDQTALAKKIVEGEGESVKTLTAALNTQLKDVDAKRADLEQLYKDAADSFGKAAGKAGQRVAELNTAKTDTKGAAYSTAAWEREASLLAVDRMNIDKAAAEKGLADLYASRAAWLANTLATTDDVEKVSEALNTGAAEPFNSDKLRTELGKTIDTANDAYGTVIATLDGVNLTSADLAALKPIKAMTRIVTFSDNAALADLAAANKVSPTVAKRGGTDGDLHKSMMDAVAEARESNITLPNLPASMGGTAPAKTDDATAAAPATADSPEVAEIRQSIRDLVAKFTAAEANETTVDEGLNRIKLPDSLKPMVSDVRTVVLSLGKLRAAVKDKFGDEGVAELMKNAAPGSPSAPTISSPEDIEKQIVALKITTTDENNATIAPSAEGGQPAKLVKEDGVWKLDLTELPPQAGMMAAMVGPMIKPIAASVDTVTADVQSGKLTSVADVKAALQASMKNTFGGMMGGGATAAPATEATPATQPTDAAPAGPAEAAPTTPAEPAPATPAAPADGGAGAGGR